MVVQTITADPALGRLAERLKRSGGTLSLAGLWGSSAPMVACAAAGSPPRPLLYLTAHLEQADAALDDLELFSQRSCDLLPAWESLPGEGPGQGEIQAERLRLCHRMLQRSDKPQTLVAPIQALMQIVPPSEAVRAAALTVKVGQPHDLDELTAWLSDGGFERLDRVEAPGDFARRGDILDVFAPGESDPLRLEFLDDRVESIRRFDVSTQRSQTKLEQASLLAPKPESAHPSRGVAFLDYLAKGTLVVLDEPQEIVELGQTFQARVDGGDGLMPVSEVLAALARFDQLHLARLGGTSVVKEEDRFEFQVNSLSRFEGPSGEAIAALCNAAADHHVYVFCDNASERARFEELLAERLGQVPDRMHLRTGSLHRGFEWVPAKTICVGHHEIFGRQPQRRRLRRVHATRPLESWLDLEPGDPVVHVIHGIARFTGMKTLSKGKADGREEFLTLEFAAKAKLHVPVSQVDLVQKYIGSGYAKPKLSTLGGTRWRKTTEKVADSVSELASSLLEVQAARELHEGIAYPADTTWQQEFEGSFVYEETEDQLIVADELKKDLQSPRPMDRLLCGDVGYGKTELAIRAAFKVIEYGKQVAVLVPTTVLAEQHYQTVRDRLADYPFIVDRLSRFRTPAQQKRVIDDARKGRVDVLIGTHRLLSKDVGFADLGLLIIDEEQRFGVEHKNRLRQLRHTVDVLTMTATPIPRTLHMSMLGLRDISSLATPPLDRRSIATQIGPFDAKLIRQAVLREMNRDGQVYFVHNIVRSIQSMAAEIGRIVPEARILVGHGQMKEGELENVMTDFVHHRADVLVATTIIESGIDIPRVNTIFINQADRFGLADLHQLRGRVGRSRHRGYCYLLLPGSRTITPKAARRLKSIEEFSELGAGFQIAMRDLEIRGAGNVLGPEQSGHIAAVGYELFCQLLDQAVKRAKGESASGPGRVQLELNVAGHVPASYVAAERARVDVYKRVVSCQTIEALRQTERDIQDAYGRFPPAVGRLMELAEIRVRAGLLGIRSIVLTERDVVFSVKDHRRLESILADVAGTVRMPDARTIHWRPPPNYLEPDTLLTVLRKYLSEPAEVTA
ncbi:MAG: transcription-repair coupling factor [Phycisphaerae bacterium]